ncbi:MAG TPA: NAD(P)H-dependent glycerol-3-phosphate dehydrogenase [Rhodospirillales bacterium]|jgi:glycerol-3-phosphate dehydrogenase (NAD(P)+)|nr:NAD(P)H-dependent glycerol-3-phosphate dehydrogenase [Rhodospirillales bacterium]
MSKIGIIGAGAWGTALAMAAIRAGNEVVIQAHEPEVAEAINLHHENSIFLPSYELDLGIKATSVMVDAVDADVVLLVAPAQHMRGVCDAAAADWPSGVPAIICAKGIEQGSCALMSEVVGEMLPGKPIAVLSGPTFAAEVARDLPTAVTLACDDETMAKVLMETLSTRYFRIYRSRDVIGSQIGGAVKNVLAIACGIVEGRKLGDNTRAALVTRGLAEISRLGIAKGAHAETLAGLSGMGDLTLTCNAVQSRNFSLGVALGSGQRLEDILSERNSVAEGVFTASSVTDLARRLNVDLPICSAVDGVLNHGANIDATINGLLARPLKAETT